MGVRWDCRGMEERLSAGAWGPLAVLISFLLAPRQWLSLGQDNLVTPSVKALESGDSRDAGRLRDPWWCGGVAR